MSKSQSTGSARQQGSFAREHLEAAADWFARLRDGEADETVRRDWRLWLAQDYGHQAAWDFVASAGQRLSVLRSDGQSRVAVSVLTAQRKKRTTRRRVLTGLAGALGLGVSGWAASRFTPLPEMATAWRADAHTAIGEIRELALADGIRLWLGTASAIDVTADGEAHGIALRQGELFVATRGATAGPLYVSTAHGSMTPLGTRFAVRDLEHATLLAVFEGAVELRTAAGGERRRVEAGEQVVFTAAAIGPVEAADPAREAWTRGILLARDMTLGEVAAELERYHVGRLSVAPEVAGLRVVGGYPLRDPGRSLAMLADVLPIRIDRSLPWWTRIEPDR